MINMIIFIEATAMKAINPLINMSLNSETELLVKGPTPNKEKLPNRTTMCLVTMLPSTKSIKTGSTVQMEKKHSYCLVFLLHIFYV
jgi:hypothetical protein